MQRAPICPPTCLPTPRYHKVNPADAPIMIISLTSDKYDVTKLYDLASTILEQRLSQINGVGQVFVGGGATPSVRVEVNPKQLESYGLTLGSVQSVLSLQNSHEPRGQISNQRVSEDILDNDQISTADQYKPLIVGYHNGAGRAPRSDVPTSSIPRRISAPPAIWTGNGPSSSSSSASPAPTSSRPSIAFAPRCHSWQP